MLIRRLLQVSLAVAALACSCVGAFAASNPVPLIYQALNPVSTAPGGPAFTLTVNGTGFVSGAVVNWNGSPRTTTFVSSSQLTAQITATDIATAGTAVITVTNPAPGGGTSNLEYFLVANPSTPTSFTVFSNNEIDGSRSGRSNILVGDFNGDGKLDLLAYLNGFIYVLPGNGDSTFGTPIASSGPPVPPAGASDPNTYVTQADLNGDGKPDLIVINANGTFIFLGNGDGTFQLTGTLTDVPLFGSVVVADFNGDGFLDFAYVIPEQGGPPLVPSAIQVQLGNGSGGFQAGPHTSNPDPLQALVRVLAVGDFLDVLGPGRPELDLLVSGNLKGGCIAPTPELSLFPGNGDGSFGLPGGLNGGICGGQQAQSNAVVADFNGDGIPDIAYFTSVLAPGGVPPAGFLTVNLGQVGGGGFTLPVQLLNTMQNSVIGPVIAGDFNNDGKLDLVAGNQIFYGNGDGSFTPMGPPSNNLQVVQAGDFNGDGRLDLVALGSTDGFVHSDIRILTQIPGAPDFGGGISPTTQSVVPGNSVNYSGTVTALNGFTGSVSLSATGLPSGVTAMFTPSTITGGSGTYTLTLTVAASVPLGIYNNILVLGTSGTLSHGVIVTLIVNSSTGDFSTSLAPTSDSYQNITAGQSASYVIQVSPVAGYTGDLSFAIASPGLPAGSTAMFNPSVVHGASGTTTLTITTSTATPQNSYPINITASSGPLSHSGTVFLGVASGAGDFEGSTTPSSQNINAGLNTTFTTNLSSVNGFDFTATVVSLSVSGFPSGASAAFSTPLTNSTSLSSTLTVSVPPGTAPGTYTLTVVASGGGRIRRGIVTLTINPAP